MKKISSVIIDDEFAAIENIEILLSDYCPEIEVVGTANSISEGIKIVKSTSPELVFLDISMPPEGTGFDFLEMFPTRDFHVVFVTAHEEFSLKAIKQHAFDYLLKPIDYKELVKTVDQFQAHYKKTKKIAPSEIIKLSTDQGVHVIKTDQVLFCKASGSYTEIHIKNRNPILISKSLKFAENKLFSPQFKRIHRSYVVNTAEITRFTKEDGGFVCIGNEMIPVSKNYFNNLSDILVG